MMTQLLSAMDTTFAWMETTSIARYVAESAMFTASLSAIHLLGFTLVTGGALVANLRLLGVIFPQQPVNDVTRPASRAILLGLAISLVTGALLFLGRATAVSANGAFQIKILLLVAATIFHFTAHGSVATRASVGAQRARTTGAIGLSLWVGLAVAACAFILLE
jgi:hypothetical protein